MDAMDARCPDCLSILPLGSLGSHLLLHSQFICAACAYEGSADEAALHVLTSGHSAEWLSVSELTLNILLLRIQDSRGKGCLSSKQSTANYDHQCRENTDRTERLQPSWQEDLNSSVQSQKQAQNAAISQPKTKVTNCGDNPFAMPHTASTNEQSTYQRAQGNNSLDSSENDVISRPDEFVTANSEIEKDSRLSNLPTEDENEMKLAKSVTNFEEERSSTPLKIGDTWKVEESDGSEEYVSEVKSTNDSFMESESRDDSTRGEKSNTIPQNMKIDFEDNSSLLYCVKCQKYIKKHGWTKTIFPHLMSISHGLPRNQIVCSFCNKTSSFLAQYTMHKKRAHPSTTCKPGLLLSPSKLMAELAASFPSLDDVVKASFHHRISTMAKVGRNSQNKTEKHDSRAEKTIAETDYADDFYSEEESEDESAMSGEQCTDKMASDTEPTTLSASEATESSLVSSATSIIKTSLEPKLESEQTEVATSLARNQDINVPETRRHKKAHPSQTRRVEHCARCGASVGCRSAIHLFYHITIKSHGAFSGTESPFKCSACGGYYRSESGFTTHRKSAHGDAKDVRMLVLLSELELCREVNFAFPNLDKAAKRVIMGHIGRICDKEI